MMSQPGLSPRFWSLCALGLVAAGAGAACSATGNSNVFSGGNGGAGAGIGSGDPSGSTSGQGGDIGHFTTNNGSGAGNGTGAGAGVGGACAAEPYVAMQLPLDMYIMLDQSGSMTDPVPGGTKWSAVTQALGSFVQQPGLGGISVGLQYFPVSPAGSPNCNCTTSAGCTTAGDSCFVGICILCSASSGGSDSCNAADYAKPEVEIAPLPGVAGAIVSSLGAHMPTTSTPTSAALQGTIDHAKQWAGAHPGHVVIAVLATDGDPTECDTTLSDIDAIAATGAAADIATFVIGIGNSLGALNGIAAAGGTQQAFIVDTTQNVNAQFLAALNTIRGASLGCQYSIPVPTMGVPDYNLVNVQYTPGGGGMSVLFDHYQDKAHCPASGDGWYYDNNAKPTQILLCDSTCNTVGADQQGKIEILLGCQTKLPN